jgi:transposase
MYRSRMVRVPQARQFGHKRGQPDQSEDAARKQAPCRELLECLRDREDDVLRFTSDLRIPATSNQAERDLRPAKTQQKISGRLRSEQVTAHRYAVRGYLSTAAKHGENALTALRNAITGTPWMPPIPDSS